MSTAVITPLPARARTLSLTACARCSRIQLEGRWVNESEAIRRLRSFESASPPSFAATTCASCRMRVKRRRATARAGDDDRLAA